MLPEADELAEALLDLGVPYEDIDEAVRLSRRLPDDTEALRLLEETVRELVPETAGTGETGVAGRSATEGILGSIELPELPDAAGPHARYFPLYVFAAALPRARARHRARGIPEPVSRLTLADVGRCVALHRRRHGTGGVLNAGWPTLHFRGELYQLGRLQFQRTRIGGRTGDLLAAAGLPVGPGDPALALHVPDFMGPLTPGAVDRSLALAREFFPRHHPEEQYTVATCASWLLDPQFKRHLPGDSNIVRFQDRFRLGPPPAEPEDSVPVRFVFGTTDEPLDRLPRDTVLQRAVLDHLREGGHWFIGHGWLPL
ncbi:acyltransferase domain-containing protein [Streptomyces griseoruber]|uniref:Acyltransferase n=1 Tax=Streptomyces griseoruber TaxID=1943 RepID=A0A117RER8_9ACTN|nr:acyltransferase domain-containing protein [Streptomyces griseoruber]KUN86776.1 acyltransferase [Streptomyces griseoruber]